MRLFRGTYDEIIQETAKSTYSNVVAFFSLRDCEPCDSYKSCLPHIENEFSDQFEIIEFPLSQSLENANDVKKQFSLKFFPTLILFVKNEKISELKGAFDNSDTHNFARIYKWLLRYFKDADTLKLESKKK